MMNGSYDDFLMAKAASVSTESVPFDSIASHLFPFQRDIVEWALRRGRAAIFANTGTGKTAMLLEWARQCSAHGRVLILSPLAVAEQTVEEATKFGVEGVRYMRKDDWKQPITVVNYDMLQHFDPDHFVAVVLDESSLLKAFDGKTRNLIIERFAKTRWKLACTATPAPNDHAELGNHSEFLGIKSRVEMLAEYFVHDGGSTQSWRLKGHARDPFWQWVCQWGVMMRYPSDLGHSDDGFILPPLNMMERRITEDPQDAFKAGMLFVPTNTTLNDQRRLRRSSMDKRIAMAIDIVGIKDPAVVWCELNDESEALAKSIPGAVEVRGSDTSADKSRKLIGFAHGEHRVMVTKPSIAGFGLNWQHCNRMVFIGASHSFEQTFQAIRRCWRFGQKRPVDVVIITAPGDDAIVANYRRKEADAAAMLDQMVRHIQQIGGSIQVARREFNPYNPQVVMEVPQWMTA